jgi:hypothetical protein
MLEFTCQGGPTSFEEHRNDQLLWLLSSSQAFLALCPWFISLALNFFLTIHLLLNRFPMGHIKPAVYRVLHSCLGESPSDSSHVLQQHYTTPGRIFPLSHLQLAGVPQFHCEQRLEVYSSGGSSSERVPFSESGTLRSDGG